MNDERAQLEVAVIGGTLDLGAGRRGVDMGPSAIRYAGLDHQLTEKLGVKVTDTGNVISPVVETAEIGSEHARYLEQILDLCDRLAGRVEAVAGRGALPLVLGGDHSVALGSLVGMAKVRGAGGVVWVDAHGDLNTPETSPSGNAWGMPLRMVLDAGDVACADVALVGARNLDLPEVEFMEASGIDADVERALRGCDRVYVAFDCDVLRPGEAAVFMPEPGGPTLADAEVLLWDLVGRSSLAGLGLTGLREEADPASLLRLTSAACL